MAEIKKYFDPLGNELIPVTGVYLEQISTNYDNGGMYGTQLGFDRTPEIYDYILSKKPINETIITIADINTNKQITIFKDMPIGYNEDDENDIFKQSFYYNAQTSDDKEYGGTRIYLHITNNQNDIITRHLADTLQVGTHWGSVRLHLKVYGLINLDNDNNILNYYYIVLLYCCSSKDI